MASPLLALSTFPVPLVPVIYWAQQTFKLPDDADFSGIFVEIHNDRRPGGAPIPYSFYSVDDGDSIPPGRSCKFLLQIDEEHISSLRCSASAVYPTGAVEVASYMISFMNLSVRYSGLDIGCFPMDPRSDPLSGRFWAAVNRSIEPQVAALAEDANDPWWAWWLDLYWLTHVAAHPDFPLCPRMPPHDPRIPIEGLFYSSWEPLSTYATTTAAYEAPAPEIEGDEDVDEEEARLRKNRRVQLWQQFLDMIARRVIVHAASDK